MHVDIEHSDTHVSVWFFFSSRRRHTRLQGDWSSDVCSSDLGFFLEIYQAERYAARGIAAAFVQDNMSRSAMGVLRGLHLQNPNTQGKLVCALAEIGRASCRERV